jgi:hypothetical protein
LLAAVLAAEVGLSVFFFDMGIPFRAFSC